MTSLAQFKSALLALSANSPTATGEFWTVMRRNDNIVAAYLDCRDDQVNTLTSGVIDELELIVNEAAGNWSWKGLVITTTKDKPGIAGANVLQIADLIAEGNSREIVNATDRIKEIFLKLSRLPIPTVAMMNGASWFGGGFELAAFCDYRIGTHSLKVGLPEVKLGLIPGAGGTQMVPRLMARLTDAVEFITGISLSAPEALHKGLIDEIASDEIGMWHAAAQYCFKNASARRRLRRRLRWGTKMRRAWQTARELTGLFGPRAGKVVMETLAPSLLEKLGGPGRYWLLKSIELMIKSKTITSAPLTAARLVVDSRDLSLDEGLMYESQGFASECLSPVARGAMFLFTNKKGARDAFAGVEIPAIDTLGIIGAAGPMGAGIAALYAAAPEIKKLVLIDIAEEPLKDTLLRIEKHLADLPDGRRQAALAKIVTGTVYDLLADCQAIIEAVPEKLALKRSVYKQIAAVMDARPDSGRKCFLFTNTSALDLDQLAMSMEGGLEVGAFSGDAGHFGGLHFFNPPEAMNVVEVPRAQCTTNETMAVAVYLAAIAGKAPIPCANKPGFVVNRILGPYLVMTAWLLAMGVAPEEIDKAMRHAGAPMGPTVLLDKVGVDIAASVAATLGAAFGTRMSLPEDELNVLKFLLDNKHLGEKTGAGIYLWQDGKPARDSKGRLVINPALQQAFPNLGENKTMARESIQYLLLGAVINEALRAAEDGVVAPQHLKWIDVGFSFGTGVDAVYGGPLHHLDAWGVRTFDSLTRAIAASGQESWRQLFVPCALLEQLSAKGECFESWRTRAGATPQLLQASDRAR